MDFRRLGKRSTRVSVRWDMCVLEPADRETGAPELRDRTAPADFSILSARADVLNEFTASAKNEGFAFLDQSRLPQFRGRRVVWADLRPARLGTLCLHRLLRSMPRFGRPPFGGCCPRHPVDRNAAASGAHPSECVDIDLRGARMKGVPLLRPAVSGGQTGWTSDSVRATRACRRDPRMFAAVLASDSLLSPADSREFRCWFAMREDLPRRRPRS